MGQCSRGASSENHWHISNQKISAQPAWDFVIHGMTQLWPQFSHLRESKGYHMFSTKTIPSFSEYHAGKRIEFSAARIFNSCHSCFLIGLFVPVLSPLTWVQSHTSFLWESLSYRTDWQPSKHMTSNLTKVTLIFNNDFTYFQSPPHCTLCFTQKLFKALITLLPSFKSLSPHQPHTFKRRKMRAQLYFHLRKLNSPSSSPVLSNSDCLWSSLWCFQVSW